MTAQNPWPLHPQPLEGESLTSWLGRQARANGIPVRSFLAYYLGNGEWRRRDLDLLEGDSLTSLAILGSVKGGESALQRTTLARWRHMVRPKNEADHKSWINSLWVTRYCPICLSRDKIAHLRLVWRFHFLPLCAEHGVLLRRECCRCGQTQPLLHFFESGPAVCRSCGSSLCESPTTQPENCPRLIRLASTIVEILDGQRQGLPDSSYTTSEFFESLRVLLRLFGHYQPKEKSWEELCCAHNLPLPQTTPFDWRTNEAVACVLMEESLRVMEAWPASTREFVRNNLTMFGKDARYLVWNPIARSALERDFELQYATIYERSESLGNRVAQIL